MNLCSHKHYFGISAEWMLLAIIYCKSPCDSIGGAVKTILAKRGLQRSLNNQILDYKAIRYLCESEIMSIQVF